MRLLYYLEICMKRFARLAAIILGVMVLAILALTFFVDANRFRPMLES